MKTMLIICFAGLLVLTACTEQELHAAICSGTGEMSWKEKLFCLVYAPEVKACHDDKNCPPGQHCNSMKGTCEKYDLKTLYYGCNSPPYSEDDCVKAAVNDYKSKNLCPPSSSTKFEKVQCTLQKHFDQSTWDCYISAQCT